MLPPACPYCRVLLKRTPAKRTRCANCGESILIRKGWLCTQDEARAIDVCTRVGVPLDRLWDERDLLSAKFGHSATATDAAWGVLNQFVVTTADCHERGMVYLQMARFLWDEGRDHLEVARQSRQMELAHWKEAEDRGSLNLSRARVVVITAKDASCPECRELEGVQFTYAEAVEKMPIPVVGCKR